MSTPDAPTPPDAQPPAVPPSQWVAPSGSAPAGAPQTPPSPYGSPPMTPGPAPAQPRTGMHPGVLAAIIGGAVLFLGAAVGVVFLASNLVTGFAHDDFAVPNDLPAGDQTPLIEGEPGSPLAVTPTECAAACFDGSSLRAVILDDSVFGELKLTEHEPWYQSQATTAADEFASSRDGWESSELGPDECFITWPYAPINDPVDAENVADDAVDYLGVHSDIDYYNEVDQVSRLFPDDESASAYMVALDERIGDCPRYIDDIGLKTDFITRSAAIDVPASVAAVGWIQKTQYNERYYVIDVQRGNLVVRSTGYSTGGYRELDFRSMVEQQAALLSELEPVG